MHNRGKIVVLSIFAGAFAMASFALWWNLGWGKRSLDFWVKEGGLAIRDAKQVQLLKLKSTSSASKESGKETLSRDGLVWEIVETKDVTGEHGLVHARHAFLEDASFQWDQEVPFSNSDWQYAVRFSGKTGQATALLDLKKGRVASWEQQRTARLSNKTASGWKQFMSRYFPDETAKPSASSGQSK